MKINNYIWENDLSINDLVLKQKEEIERLKEDYLKEKYLVDKYTRQLTDEYKNTEYQCKEKERLSNIINELEKDIENQIIFCTNEANGTTNDKYCRIAINYLKHLKDKLQELKGSE